MEMVKHLSFAWVPLGFCKCGAPMVTSCHCPVDRDPVAICIDCGRETTLDKLKPRKRK